MVVDKTCEIRKKLNKQSVNLYNALSKDL